MSSISHSFVMKNTNRKIKEFVAIDLPYELLAFTINKCNVYEWLTTLMERKCLKKKNQNTRKMKDIK